MYTTRITEDRELFTDEGTSGSIPPTIPTEGSLSAQGTQPQHEGDPQPPVDGNEDSPRAYQPTPQGVSGSDISPIRDSVSRMDSPQGLVPRRKRGRDELEPEQTLQPGPSVTRRSEHGRVPRRFFQIEENIFFCMPLEIEEPTSYVEAVDSPN